MPELAWRMLKVILTYTERAPYIAGWTLCNQMGVDAAQLNCQIPGTPHDQALEELLKKELIEEVPELGYRYRIVISAP